MISDGRPGTGWLNPGMSDRGSLDFREANRRFESTATFASAQSTLTGAGDAVRVAVAAVTANFFTVLGAHRLRISPRSSPVPSGGRLAAPLPWPKCDPLQPHEALNQATDTNGSTSA